MTDLSMKNILVMGASSGIGKAVAEYLAPKVKELVTVSRSSSPHGQWIQADVTKTEDIRNLKHVLKDRAIDALLYLGGTWEKHAFTPGYDFEASPDEETQHVLNVNLLGPIRMIQTLLPNLGKSGNPKIILMGALVRDHPFQEVANTASKFGLDGIVKAIRSTAKFRERNIGITVIHPGNVATPEVLNDLHDAGKPPSYAIPLADMCMMIHCLLSLSNRSNINELQMASMLDL